MDRTGQLFGRGRRVVAALASCSTVVASTVLAGTVLAGTVLAGTVLAGAVLATAAEAREPASEAAPQLNELAATEAELAVNALLPDPAQLHPDLLAQVSFDLGPVRDLADQLSAARDAAAEAQGRIDRESNRLAALAVRAEVLDVTIRLAAADEAVDASVRRARDDDLATFAVATFTGFEAMALRDMGAEVDTQAAVELAEQAERTIYAAALDARAQYARSVERHLELVAERAAVEDDEFQTGERLAVAEADFAQADAEADRLAPSFERALLRLTVPGTDIPVVVLDAYYRAEVAFAESRPSCGVTWSHLAGIGKSESNHGSFGGNVVGRDGRTSGEILGPQLNGDPFQAIPDTDGGVLDGDLEWDRAVGPMQFIPSSWEIYGRDGNGDRRTDPHNIYDAAQAAAAHLCGTTGGLGNPANFQQALLGYNRSAAYGYEVMGNASGYQAAVGLRRPANESV